MDLNWKLIGYGVIMACAYLTLISDWNGISRMLLMWIFLATVLIVERSTVS